MIITVIAQTLVIVYPGVFVFWFIFHIRIDYWRKLGKQAYLFAGVGWPVISSTILLFSAEIFRVRWPFHWVTGALGLAAAVGALRFGTQASRIISRRTLIGLVELEPQKNVQPVMQTGIYAKTRNPIYLTHWLILLAAAALSGYAANWIFLAIDSLLLPLLISTEEKELIGRYGKDYRNYMQRVPRFFPRWPW